MLSVKKLLITLGLKLNREKRIMTHEVLIAT